MNNEITESIKCPSCHRVSYNTNDIQQKYCGACHNFHEFLKPTEWK